jgi:hypothetical protein
LPVQGPEIFPLPDDPPEIVEALQRSVQRAGSLVLADFFAPRRPQRVKLEGKGLNQ